MYTKTWFLFVATLNFLFVALMVKLYNRIKSQVPEGYQDETGFHFGAQK